MTHEDYNNIELTESEMESLNDIILDNESTVSQNESVDEVVEATDKTDDAVQSAEKETATEELDASEPVPESA